MRTRKVAGGRWTEDEMQRPADLGSRLNGGYVPGNISGALQCTGSARSPIEHSTSGSGRDLLTGTLPMPYWEAADTA